MFFKAKSFFLNLLKLTHNNQSYVCMLISIQKLKCKTILFKSRQRKLNN